MVVAQNLYLLLELIPIIWIVRSRRLKICMQIQTYIFFFFPRGWGESDPSVDACLYASILRIRQMIWVWRATVEWNIDRENRRTRRKTCPSSTLSITNPTWIDPGANLGLHGERPATNDLSHGTDLQTYLQIYVTFFVSGFGNLYTIEGRVPYSYPQKKELICLLPLHYLKTS
jgi:hypothetical protein